MPQLEIHVSQTPGAIEQQDKLLVRIFIAFKSKKNSRVVVSLKSQWQVDL